jgi:S1-C subfamily serine protease
MAACLTATWAIAAQTVRARWTVPAVDGLLVSSIAEDGPAARAGLLVSRRDRRKVDGEPVGSLAALRDRMVVGAQVSMLVSPRRFCARDCP